MPRLLPWFRLVRAGTLFSPGCDVLAGCCIAAATRAGAGTTEFDAAWLLPAFASICVYAAGMVANDLADRREDAKNRPERPLPRGDITVAGAAALCALLLAAAMALSPCRSHHALLGGLALLYDFALKHVRPLGAALMGTLRGLNLWTAAVVFAPVPGGDTALLVAAICYGVYIAAVTVLGILEDVAKPPRLAVVAVQWVPPLAAVVGLVVVQRAAWPAPTLALLPLAVFARHVGGIVTWDQKTIRRSMVLLLLGTMLYTALLALAAGNWPVALAIAACIVPARRISRRISLT